MNRLLTRRGRTVTRVMMFLARFLHYSTYDIKLLAIINLRGEA